VTISQWKTRLKVGCAVGFAVVIVAGWFSGSYRLAAHRERFRQLQELRVQNWELSREISEKKNHLAALKRGERPQDLRCTLPKLAKPACWPDTSRALSGSARQILVTRVSLGSSVGGFDIAL